MHAARELYSIGTFITFSLRLGILWLLCALFSRVLRRPGQRFRLWLIFSLGSAAYWIASVAMIIVGPSVSSHTSIYAGSFGHIVLPASWAPALTAVAWLLTGAYVVGFSIFYGFRVWNRLRLKTLLQYGSEASTAFVTVLDQLCKELGVKHCKLIVLPGIMSPATVYWLRPRIILPEICHHPDRLAEFSHIMRHELAHIVRRDFLLSSVIDAVCTLLFFHPAVWVARKQMRMERELACDLAVVEACPDDRADYASSLAHFVRLNFLSRNSSSAVQFAAPASLLGKRIRTILLEPVAAPAWNRLCSAGLVATMLVTFALFTPQLSLSLDVARTIEQRVASAQPVTAQRMKRHLKLSDISYQADMMESTHSR
ncbi:MAG TPA: M56 family metallopeptidase [Terriglobales bacterium]|nr:M56 family metallopeptidase [Terriglobales bacterium]